MFKGGTIDGMLEREREVIFKKLPKVLSQTISNIHFGIHSGKHRRGNRFQGRKVKKAEAKRGASYSFPIFCLYGREDLYIIHSRKLPTSPYLSFTKLSQDSLCEDDMATCARDDLRDLNVYAGGCSPPSSLCLFFCT